jgi:hypothetical protein
MAVLIPAGQQLRDEFNTVFPRRDRASDGWIADALHNSSSHHSPDESSKVLRDHDADSKNEVHAIDVDEDLRDAQTTMAECVMEVWRRHREGLDNRVTEIIYEGWIATAARGWVWRRYSGRNPHDKHAHFSFSYVTNRENDRRSFGVAALASKEDSVTQPATSTQNADAVWEKKFQIPGTTGTENQRTAGDLLRYLYSLERIATRVDQVLGDDFTALRTQIEGLSTVVRAIGAAEVADDDVRDAKLTELQDAVNAMPTAEENAQALLDSLPADSDEETAERLRAVLGDRAEAVGRLLVDGGEQEPAEAPAAT